MGVVEIVTDIVKWIVDFVSCLEDRIPIITSLECSKEQNKIQVWVHVIILELIHFQI